MNILVFSRRAQSTLQYSYVVGKLFSVCIVLLVVASFGCGTLAKGKELPETQSGTTVKVLPSTPTIPVVDSATMANVLSSITHRPTIFLIQDENQIRSAITTAWPNGEFQSQGLQAFLNQIGAISYSASPLSVTCIVQGRAYVAAKTPARDVDGTELSQWHLLTTGFNQLNAPSQQSLLTKGGLTFPISLEGCPETWKQLIAPVMPDFLSSDQVAGGHFRVRLTLGPVVHMAFPTPPTGLHRGWWNYTYFPTYSNYTSIDFLPLVSTSDRFPNLNIAPVSFPAGYIDSLSFAAAIKKANSWKVQVNPDVTWPKVVIAGGPVTVGAVLECLIRSATVDVRIFEKQKLIFISKPNAINNLLGDFWLPQSDFALYQRLIVQSSKPWQDDLGPIPNGIFLVPLRAIPPAVAHSILASPYGWDDQTNYPRTPADADKRADASEVQYNYSDALIVPALDLGVKVETDSYNHGKDGWITTQQGPIRFSPISL